MVKVGRFIKVEDQPEKANILENQFFGTSTGIQLSAKDTKYFRCPPKLEELGAHCLLHVISFLGVLDTINLGRTSELMKAIAKLSFIRFSHVSFGDLSIGVSELPSILKDLGKDLRSAEISGLNLRILDSLLENCPNLTQVKLVDSSNIISSISFAKYLPFLKNITDLEIRKSGIYYSKMSRAKRFENYDSLLATLAEVEKLNSLKIDYIETSHQTFQYLLSIKSLRCLHLNRFLQPVPILPIIPMFSHLKEILLTIEDSKTGEIVSELLVEG